MTIIAWGLLGVLLGAAGVEYLRATRPELIKGVEEAARRFAESFSSAESSDSTTEKE